MAKEWAKAFYNSKAWKKCRTAYIAYRVSVDGGLCEVCKERIGTMVHHTKKLTPGNINNPDISLNHKLLKLECKECHDKENEHFNSSRKESKLLCAFDNEGNPVPIKDTPPC